MLTPTFRFVALPLAAIVALSVLSMQPAVSKASRDNTVSVREQVTDCSALSATEVCVIAHGS